MARALRGRSSRNIYHGQAHAPGLPTMRLQRRSRSRARPYTQPPPSMDRRSLRAHRPKVPIRGRSERGGILREGYGRTPLCYGGSAATCSELHQSNMPHSASRAKSLIPTWSRYCCPCPLWPCPCQSTLATRLGTVGTWGAQVLFDRRLFVEQSKAAAIKDAPCSCSWTRAWHAGIERSWSGSNSQSTGSTRQPQKRKALPSGMWGPEKRSAIKGDVDDWGGGSSRKAIPPDLLQGFVKPWSWPDTLQRHGQGLHRLDPPATQLHSSVGTDLCIACVGNSGRFWCHLSSPWPRINLGWAYRAGTGTVSSAPCLGSWGVAGLPIEEVVVAGGTQCASRAV